MAEPDIFTLSNFGIGMTRNMVPPALKKTCEEMQEHLSKHAARGVISSANTYVVFPITANIDATAIVIMACQGQVVIYRTLILGSTVGPMPARTEKFAQASWTVPGMPGDVITDMLTRVVNEAVKAQVPSAGRVIAISPVMLDPTLDISDIAAMLKIADESIKTAEVALARMNHATAVKEAENRGVETPAAPVLGMQLSLLREGDILLVEPRFNDEVCRGADGTIYRGSWSLAIYAKRNNNGGGSQGTRVLLASVAGYTDFKWDASNGVIDPNRPGYSTDGKKLTTRFLPEHVITCVDTGNMPSTETVLLAVAMAPLIITGRRWMSQFFNTHQGDQTLARWRDLGALGIEGLRDPNTDVFGPKVMLSSNMVNEAARMVGDLVDDQCVFSAAISRTGFDQVTWQGVSAALSINDAQSSQKTAWLQLIAAADNLTGNRFSTLMTKHGLTQAVNGAVQPNVNDYYTPVGRLIGPGGRDYALADVDYLALANTAGEQFPDVLQRWTDTQNVNSAEWPATRRLAMQLQILQEVFAGMRVQVTDIGRTVRLGSGMLNCLGEAVNEALRANGVRLEFPDDPRFSVAGQGRANAGSAGYVNTGMYSNMFTAQTPRSSGLSW